MRIAAFTAVLLMTVAVPVMAQMSPTFPAEFTERLAGADDIAFTGHHALFDANGRLIEPSLPQLEGWIAREYERISAKRERRLDGPYRELAEVTGQLDLPLPMEQSVLLGWLAENSERPDRAQLVQLNLAVRQHWYLAKIPNDAERDKRIDRLLSLPKAAAEVLAKLKLAKADSRADEIDDMSSREYREYCRENGVPVPPDWLKRSGDMRGSWEYEGFLNQDSSANGGNDMDRVTNFLTLGRNTEVWSYRSTSPRGTCIALPRFASDKRISANGIICLGLDSGNACFYDRAGLDVDQDYPIDQFETGPNLTDGVCTDCHAGENPYIVHPAEPLNLGTAIRSPRWHTPFVRSSWPQNPGPSFILDQIQLPPDERPCSDCHTQTYAGRFPDVLALNYARGGSSGYCTAVMEGALNGIVDPTFGPMQGPTMAMTTDNNGNVIPDPAYDTHRTAMLALCKQSPIPPGEVPAPTDDREVVGPPVIGPLYACVEVIEVRGAIYGAKVFVTVNGTDSSSVVATSSESLQFQVPALATGDTVSATQEIDGIVATSGPQTVYSHLDDYPNGLPAPEIDPTLVHQCGRVIAVRHAPGATVSVTVNGGDLRDWKLGGVWTNVRPGKSPFDLGDAFRATQQICDDLSDASAQVVAVAPPNPMPMPRLAPDPAVEGQPYIGVENLANGQRTRIGEASAGDLLSFSTAVNWNPEIDVASPLGRTIVAGDQFTIIGELCDKVSVETDKVRPCEVLEAPTIRQPLVGDTSVIVTQARPGARILVFDAGSTKIGDGSGSEVGLTRALVDGDVLRVAQRLGRCESREAYQIAVVCVTEDCK